MFGCSTGKGDDVQIVQENPENFFGYIDNLFTPNPVWPWSSHLKNKADWSLRLTWLRVAKIR
jgi:hypothetical protein